MLQDDRRTPCHLYWHCIYFFIYPFYWLFNVLLLIRYNFVFWRHYKCHDNSDTLVCLLSLFYNSRISLPRGHVAAKYSVSLIFLIKGKDSRLFVVVSKYRLPKLLKSMIDSSRKSRTSHSYSKVVALSHWIEYGSVLFLQKACWWSMRADSSRWHYSTFFVL